MYTLEGQSVSRLFAEAVGFFVLGLVFCVGWARSFGGRGKLGGSFFYCWQLGVELSCSITRSPAQGPMCKDLGRNGQNRAITPKATYTTPPKRAGSRSALFYYWQLGVELPLSITRSQAQKPAHKDLEPKWPKPSHLGTRPLMLRFLTALVHAHTTVTSSMVAESSLLEAVTASATIIL